MPTVVSRIMESVAYRGVMGTVRAAVRGLLGPVLNDKRVVSFAERRFDRRFNVRTAGKIRSQDLSIGTPAAQHASNYEPVPPLFVTETIAGLHIDHRDFTFVDFGCGKGKAILLASSFPFKKIIGVELARDLAAIAEENVKSYRSPGLRCRALEVVHMDAAEFPIPAGPVVCYFFDPFGEQIMARIIENIAASLARDPREVIVVYVNPRLGHLFERQPLLTNVRRKYWCSIYRSRSGDLLHCPQPPRRAE